jgi:hypothetical protein
MGATCTLKSHKREGGREVERKRRREREPYFHYSVVFLKKCYISINSPLLFSPI